MKKLKELWHSIWIELKDWRTLILFLFVVLIISVEVWLPYIIALIIGVNTETGIWLVGVASACWLFWLGPFTPFIPLCIAITFALKKVLRRIKKRIHPKCKKLNMAEFQDSALDYLDN